MSYSEVWSPNKNSGTGGFKKSIIVVHTSEPGPYARGKNPGTAIGLGRYISSPSVQASYHIMVDPNGDVCRSLVDEDRAWAAGGIANNEGYHICAVGWSAWSREEWLSMPRMLDSMAVEIARWCKKEGIPANFVPAKDLPNNVWGITGHGDTAIAWRQTDHTDPGRNFPYDVLLDKVKTILGQKPVSQKTAIQLCREANSWLGKITIDKDELITPDTIGRFATYEKGAIYWSPLTGAQAISIEMLAKFAEYGFEAGFLGFPINTVHEIAGGRAQAFQGGSIYYSEATGAHTIGGQIGSKWAANNWQLGYMGFPETDEILLPDKVGKLQKFQGCHVYHSPTTGTFAIQGIIWDRFTKESYERGIGYAISDETPMPIKPGKFQIFEQGHIYWKEGSEKAFAVYYDFMDLYSRLGYETGRLGFVISAKELVEGASNTWIQHFEGGSIQINRDTKETILIINGENIKV